MEAEGHADHSSRHGFAVGGFLAPESRPAGPAEKMAPSKSNRPAIRGVEVGSRTREPNCHDSATLSKVDGHRQILWRLHAAFLFVAEAGLLRSLRRENSKR